MVLPQKQTQRSPEQSRTLKSKPHSYSYLIFYKRIKNIHWRRNSLLKNGAGKPDVHIRRNKSDPYL
jgi:hypothetical protein